MGLTGDFGTLRRALVADRLGEDRAAELYPERLDHDVPILRGEGGGEAERDRAAGETRIGNPRTAERLGPGTLERRTPPRSVDAIPRPAEATAAAPPQSAGPAAGTSLRSAVP